MYEYIISSLSDLHLKTGFYRLILFFFHTLHLMQCPPNHGLGSSKLHSFTSSIRHQPWAKVAATQPFKRKSCAGCDRHNRKQGSCALLLCTHLRANLRVHSSRAHALRGKKITSSWKIALVPRRRKERYHLFFIFLGKNDVIFILFWNVENKD
jgi:hypothetical protein